MIKRIVKQLVRKNPQLKALFGDKDSTEVIKGTVTTSSMMVVGFFISLVFNVILARLYGAEAMGILALCITVFSIFSLFGLIGTQIATVRFIAQFADDGKNRVLTVYGKVLSLVIPLSVIAGAFFFFLSPIIADKVFHKPNLTIPFQIVALVIPFGAFQTINTASLQGLKKIRDSFFFQTIFPPLMNTIILIAITYLVVRNYLAPIYAYTMTVLIASILTAIIWFKRARQIFSIIPNPVDPATQPSISLRRLLSVSLPMFFSSSMTLIMQWTDIFILGIYCPSKEVGIYRIALKIALPTSFILAAVNSIAAPKFSELFFKGEKEGVRKIAKFSSKLTFFLSLPVIAVSIFFARELMGIFGYEFVIGSQALIILSVGRLLHTYFGPNGTLLNMTGHEKIFGYIMFSGVVLNIVLNIILVPIYGIIGAASATTISTTYWNLITSLFIYKNYGYWISYLPRFSKIS